MPVRIQFRRGTQEEWTTEDPVLMEGELGAEIDTGRWKIGDGVNRWNALGYGTESLESAITQLEGNLSLVCNGIDDMNSLLETIKTNQTSGEQIVKVSGNDVVIGLLADRPPASEMRGRGYYAWDETDGHKLKYSDGTDWVVNQ